MRVYDAAWRKRGVEVYRQGKKCRIRGGGRDDSTVVVGKRKPFLDVFTIRLGESLPFFGGFFVVIDRLCGQSGKWKTMNFSPFSFTQRLQSHNLAARESMRRRRRSGRQCATKSAISNFHPHPRLRILAFYTELHKDANKRSHLSATTLFARLIKLPYYQPLKYGTAPSVVNSH